MKKFLNGPWVLILPTIIVLTCVVFLPLLISLWTSFTPFKLTKPDTLYRFVGLRNYERLIGDYDFLGCVWKNGFVLNYSVKS
jgi:multiple sugar transport system permease protein